MPYKPEQREYRSFAAALAPVPQTSDERVAYTVEGYATTFDDAYELYRDYDDNPVYERISRDALAGADMSDVIFQLNHDGAPLARMRNGSLEVACDEHGIRVRAQLGGSREGRDLYEAIANGLIDRMSWGFNIAPDGWEWDDQTRTHTIIKVSKVFDVSAVSIPANEGTEIHARSHIDGVIDAGRQELLARDRARRERMALALSI